MKKGAFKSLPQELFNKVLQGACSQNELDAYLKQHPEHKEQLTELLYLQKLLADRPYDIDVSEALQKVKQSAGISHTFSKRSIFTTYRYGLAAAAVAVLLGITFSLTYFFRSSGKPELAAIPEVLPSAYLQLSDGRTVDLHTSQQAEVEDSDVQISLNGQGIDYKSDKHSDGDKVVYNTLVVPNAGEYTLRLTDGTVIYVNSGSTLEFPVPVPKQGIRKVRLTGEAYFEVAKLGKDSRFIVETDRGNVEVLGTQFNVSSYPNDKEWHTTLVSGKVAYSSADGTSRVELQPSQQVALGADNSYSVQVVDVEAYTLWKDGVLKFSNLPLGEIAKRLERWYDVQISFADNAAALERFTGLFRKTEPVETILHTMAETNKIEVDFKDNRYTIATK